MRKWHAINFLGSYTLWNTYSTKGTSLKSLCKWSHFIFTAMFFFFWGMILADFYRFSEGTCLCPVHSEMLPCSLFICGLRYLQHIGYLGNRASNIPILNCLHGTCCFLHTLLKALPIPAPHFMHHNHYHLWSILMNRVPNSAFMQVNLFNMHAGCSHSCPHLSGWSISWDAQWMLGLNRIKTHDPIFTSCPYRTIFKWL